MIASLGMYDHPAQHAANDRLWREIARRLRACGVREVPDTLDRSRPVQELWRDPGLLFGQVCGYPLVSDASLSLSVLALPLYDAPGCASDAHRSFVIVREQDRATALSEYRGRHAAINDPASNSGMNLFRATVAGIAGGGQFFASVAVTGSHRDSVRAVAAGEADIAAIDAVTYAALERFEPVLTDGLHILAETSSSPTLPFVTARTIDSVTVAALRDALAQTLADPDLADVRAALFLTGVTEVTGNRFASLLGLERDAALAGYPELR